MPRRRVGPRASGNIVIGAMFVLRICLITRLAEAGPVPALRIANRRFFVAWPLLSNVGLLRLWPS